MPPDAPHPAATVLRHRSGELRRLADAIERAAVFALEATPDGTDSPRMALCRRMLTGNLQQLLRAADDLRDIAWRGDTRAAQLDARHGADQVA